MDGDKNGKYPFIVGSGICRESPYDDYRGEIFSSEKNQETQEKVWYLILGGSYESMKKRVGAVVKEIKSNPNRKVFVTWYNDEIEKIMKFMLEDKVPIKNDIIKVLSYDTVTNILNVAKKSDNFAGCDKLIIPTSHAHGDRVRMIFEKKLPNVKVRLEIQDSKETEVWYANVASWIYRIFNPSLLQYASIVFRPITFCRGYLFPLMKEKLKTRKALFDVFSQTPQFSMQML